MAEKRDIYDVVGERMLELSGTEFDDMKVAMWDVDAPSVSAILRAHDLFAEVGELREWAKRKRELYRRCQGESRELLGRAMHDMSAEVVNDVLDKMDDLGI